MSSLNGVDRVQQCEGFLFAGEWARPGPEQPQFAGSGSAWYDIFHQHTFYQIGSRYPGRASYQAKMRAIADSLAGPRCPY